MSLAVRSGVAELMDGAGVDFRDYATCLRQLAQVNLLTLAHRPTLAWLARAARRRDRTHTLAVFDVAFGQGDMLRSVARWARRTRHTVWLGGVDMNPNAARVAADASPGLPLHLQTGNVLTAEPSQPPDYIVSSLFTHHLSDAEVVAFVQWMERHARHGWFVNDLHRSAIAAVLFRLLGWAMRWHPIVRYDGAVSIARSFRRADWERLLAEAGVAADVQWVFPFRLCVSRLR